MQVSDKRVKNNTTFESVGIGEVFCWEGKFWMRTKLCVVSGTFCNAVNITDGSLLAFENYEYVEKLDAELIIR